MDKWICELCGYVYDPAMGCEEAAPGTAFDDLPDDWECPECLAPKDRFVSEHNASSLRKGPRI